MVDVDYIIVVDIAYFSWRSDRKHGNSISYLHLIHSTLKCEGTGHGYYEVLLVFFIMTCARRSSLGSWHQSFLPPSLWADVMWVCFFFGIHVSLESIIFGRYVFQNRYQSTLQRNTSVMSCTNVDVFINLYHSHTEKLRVKAYNVNPGLITLVDKLWGFPQTIVIGYWNGSLPNQQPRVY